MTTTYHVQRLNAAARRFEWLTSDPGDEVLLAAGDLDWTAEPTKAADLGRERAGIVARYIAGANPVRFGNATAEERVDFADVERADAEQARAKRLAEIAAGEAQAAKEKAEREAIAEQEAARARAEQAALALAEVQRRAAAGDEQAASILLAKAEAEAAEKARKAEEAQRLKEATDMALAERHEWQTTEALAAALGLAAESASAERA